MWAREKEIICPVNQLFYLKVHYTQSASACMELFILLLGVLMLACHPLMAYRTLLSMTRSADLEAKSRKGM